MTEFLKKSFTVHLASKAYADNFDRIFGSRDPADEYIEDSASYDGPVYGSNLDYLCASKDLWIEDPIGVQEQVLAFHTAYDVKVRTEPTIPTREEVVLRLKLITEEFLELMDAAGVLDEDSPLAKELMDCAKGYDPFHHSLNMVEFADACADLDFVVEGARQVFGISGLEVAEEVFRSNMSKLGEDGKPIRRPEDNKIIKGPNFSPPDIAGVLAAQRKCGDE